MQAGTVQISIDSEASLLIIDPAGRKLGFDSEKQNVVNEIAGAEVDNETNFPTYVLPHDTSAKPYTILISGKSLKTSVRTNLTLTGPGFVVGFKGIHLAAAQTLSVAMSLDGKHLAFTAGQMSGPPTLSFAISAGRSKPSYKFEVNTIALTPGKTIVATLEASAGRLFFRDDDEKRNKYSLMMRRTNPDGTQDSYQRRDISLGGSDNYLVEYGKWDGRGPVCFKVDDGKGFENSACVELSTQPSPTPAKGR